MVLVRTPLKNVFWLNIFVGASFKILSIQPYASGFKLGSAATLNQNPIFQTNSSNDLGTNRLMVQGKSCLVMDPTNFS
jgi:hypothetical protein